MLSRFIALAAFASLAAIAVGQAMLRVEFASSGTRTVWLADAWPSGLPADPVQTEAQAIELKLPQSKTMVWAADAATGNLASIPVPQPGEGETKSGTLQVVKVADADFKYLYSVKIRIEHAGQPVSAATLTLGDSARKQQLMLAPGDGGEVRAYGIRPGSLSVAVQYKFEGKAKSLPVQSFTVNLKRDQPEQTLTLVIPDNVPTESAPKPAEGATKDGKSRSAKEPTQQTPTNPAMTLLFYLIGIAVAVGVAFLILRFVMNNPQRVEQGLARIGVQTPQPDAGGGAPAAPMPQEPIRPIILDDAEPAPIGATFGAHVPPAPGTPQVMNPRLVSESGEVLLLLDGENVLGRDESVNLPLPSEQSVSRRHAELTKSGDAVTLSDLGSTNGTYVNGVRLTTSQELHPGDQVQFGAVRYRYEV